MKKLFFISIIGLFTMCEQVSKEKRPLVNAVTQKVRDIDANHRVRIIEEDFQYGDSIYKIRGYFMDEYLLKLVGVLRTPVIERDDYFYFENQEPIFSGHLVVSKADNFASEYKFYYGDSGYVEEALFWEDRYEPDRHFPHERFREFRPDADSLRDAEEKRLMFFMSKLKMEEFEFRHLNENLEANKDK